MQNFLLLKHFFEGRNFFYVFKVWILRNAPSAQRGLCERLYRAREHEEEDAVVRTVRTQLLRCDSGLRYEEEKCVVSTWWASGVRCARAWSGRKRRTSLRDSESVRRACAKTRYKKREQPVWIARPKGQKKAREVESALGEQWSRRCARITEAAQIAVKWRRLTREDRVRSAIESTKMQDGQSVHVRNVRSSQSGRQ